MTVARLIEELRHLDPDATICVRNKDGYLDSVTTVEPTQVRKMKHYADFKAAEKISQGDGQYYHDGVQGIVLR